MDQAAIVRNLPCILSWYLVMFVLHVLLSRLHNSNIQVKWHRTIELAMELSLLHIKPLNPGKHYCIIYLHFLRLCIHMPVKPNYSASMRESC